MTGYTWDALAFQLTHLLRGATTGWDEGIRRIDISTHAPLARCDVSPVLPFRPCLRHFNSRTSCEVRPRRRSRGTSRKSFQLTHLLRGATAVAASLADKFVISTHAPLARCDGMCTHVAQHPPFQLTHLLRGATKRWIRPERGHEFQLTHLLRGATGGGGDTHGRREHFNSRTSCEVRRENKYHNIPTMDFNSRTSCEVRPLQPMVIHG